MFHHWDFFGPDAEKTAKHFEKHVLEFAQREQMKFESTGTFRADTHHTCYWVQTSQDAHSENIKKKLRPRRSLIPDEHRQLLAQLTM